MMFFLPRRTLRQAPADAGAGTATAEGGEADSALLWQRVLDGDAQALADIYRREAGPVYRYVLALAGNAAWAADATQEAFVALATRPEGYDPARGVLGAYLAGVARHALASHWRELRRLVPLPEGEDEAGDAVEAAAALAASATTPTATGAAAWGGGGADTSTPELTLARSQDIEALWRSLRALPAVFREAVVLVDLQERPYAEAARIAGVELNTLRTRLHRARARLSVLLGAAGETRPRP